ncbi:MAG: cupin domain-containing protein [Acetobacteraceae bacterium]|nr:cupin domain-containing protein [Acetobacteraceae bacterium]
MNRRRFASCAICAAVGLVASKVDAEALTAGGVTRNILQKTEYPGDKHVAILVMAEVDAGAMVARHTHPGLESAFVIEGGGILKVKGQPDRVLKPGDGFQVPPETPHSLANGAQTSRIAITYVVEKDKPLASPAPE